jgi:hypothetical protein
MTRFGWLFAEGIHNKVVPEALKKVAQQVVSLKKYEEDLRAAASPPPPCSGHFTQVYGIPCWHELKALRYTQPHSDSRTPTGSLLFLDRPCVISSSESPASLRPRCPYSSRRHHPPHLEHAFSLSYSYSSDFRRRQTSYPPLLLSMSLFLTFP